VGKIHDKKVLYVRCGVGRVKNTFKFVIFNLNSIEHLVMKTCYLSYFQIKILGSTFSIHFILSIAIFHVISL